MFEYAFYHGSIKIIQYLMMNGFKLKPSLWLFAIHSNNPELIHLLEDNDDTKLSEKEYQKCLEESVKCHHNDIANYINDNYINDIRIRRNQLLYSFKFFNYAKMAECEFNGGIFLLHACEYNYIELFKILLNDAKIDVNYKIHDAQNKNFFIQFEVFFFK